MLGATKGPLDYISSDTDTTDSSNLHYITSHLSSNPPSPSVTNNNNGVLNENMHAGSATADINNSNNNIIMPGIMNLKLFIKFWDYERSLAYRQRKTIIMALRREVGC